MVKVSSVLKTYWRQARRYKLLLFSEFIFLGLAIGGDILVPVFYKQFFDIVSSSSPTPNVAETLISVLIKILIINGAIWFGYRV
ncbi:MAG: hypothetical protein ABIF89_02855, partial [bacterium]